MTPTNEQELRDTLLPLLETEILNTGFLSEHDKNVGGTLYSPENNQKLTASALADVLSISLQPTIQSYTNAEIAKVLDRLEAQWGETIDNTLGKPIRIKFVSVSAIQAERAKLKEVK